MKIPDIEYFVNRVMSGDICKECYCLIRRGIQYLRRGFSDYQLWSLDDTISRFVYPRLKRFKEGNISFPGGCINEDEWDKILDKMILAFQLHSTQWEWDTEVGNDECNRRYDIICEGMELFGKHFMNLWW